MLDRELELWFKQLDLFDKDFRKRSEDESASQEQQTEHAMWTHAPESVLAAIFSHLDVVDKMAAADVCQSWREAMDHPDAWTSLDIRPDTFYFYPSSSTDLDPESCARKVNDKIHHCTHLSLDIKGFPDNTHVFSVLEAASHRCRRLKCVNIYDSSARPNRDTKLQLDCLARLLNRNTALCHLNLERIKFSSMANKQPLPFGLRHARALHKLRLVQSLDTCSFNNMLYLVSLSTLTITPDFLYYPMVSHLASQSLKRLNLILQGENSKRHQTITDDQWKSVCCQGRLAVGCYTKHSNKYEDSIMGKRILVPSMPVQTFIYNDTNPFPYSNLFQLVKTFASTLEEFVDFSMWGEVPVRRQDDVLETFAEHFPRLHTLAVQVPVTSTDLLTFALRKPTLVHLLVMEGQVVYPGDGDTDDVVLRHSHHDGATPTNLDSLEGRLLRLRQWDLVQSHSANRELLEQAMTSLLGRPWGVLSRDEFCEVMNSRYGYFYSKTTML